MEKLIKPFFAQETSCGRCVVRLFSLFVVVGLFASGGCGSRHGRQGLSGTIKVKGKNLDNGVVTILSDQEPSGPVSGALVRGGVFEIPPEQGVLPGTYRIAISAPVPGGTLTEEEMAAGASPRAKESLPAQFNAKTSLTIEVSQRGPNRFDFDLQ